MNDLYQEFTQRNNGIFSPEEQEKLRTTRVAIAGVGGIGGILAERLVRMGMENIKISDPDVFDTSNLNRQYGSNQQTLGRKKVEVVREELLAINPQASITADTRGIQTQEDADAFAKDVDILIDLMDYGMFQEACYLQRAARQCDAYYIYAIAIAFGALVSTFSPQGITLEEYNGTDSGGDASRLKETIAPERVIPTLPDYLKPKLETVNAMLRGEIAPGAISIGANLASLLAASETVNLILGIKPPRLAPEYTYLDLMEKTFY